MCGIGGVVCWRADARADASVARTLVRWLRHRGPDGEGTYVGRARGLAPGGAEARVACAHTRLAVIDPRPVAQGPLASDDGRILLLFNGEIYNHRSLRSGLERRGRRFRSRCDAEVVLRAYEEAGPACVAWFEGMYAFAVLDRRRGCVVLARDPAGEKPLFVAQPPGGFVFASEIAPIVAAAHAAGLALDRTLRRAWVPLQRALGFVPAPHTLLRGVESLRPGEVRLLEAGRLRVQRRLVFGRFAPAPLADSVPGDEPAERAASRPRSVLVRLRRAVERAVRARLESDVPLGGFLSGGIDSALVCALARRALGRLETFTLGFDEPGWDERAAAAATARAIGTVHHHSRVGAEALERIEAIVLRHGAPFGDESALALDRLCGWARERITVALTGDGGDELFVGYRRRRLLGPLDALDRVLPGALRRTVARVAYGGAGGRGLLAQARRLLAALGDDAAGRYARWLAVQHDPASLRAVRRAVLAAGGPAAFDLRVYLPDDLLAKSDRAAMAHGLETRAPLCDPGLARLACALPARRHAPVPWRGKALVLAAFADLLPPGIARRPKRGFGVPVGAWLRRPGWHERLAQALRHPSFREAGVAPAAHLERLLAEHRAGRADHGRALYGLWTFACFVRLFVEGELVRHAPCPPRAATV